MTVWRERLGPHREAYEYKINHEVGVLHHKQENNVLKIVLRY
jgi:hypothetical protein